VRRIWFPILLVVGAPTGVTGGSAIESAEAMIAGIELGASEAAVRKAFGEPRRDEVQPEDGRAKDLTFRGARAYSWTTGFIVSPARSHGIARQLACTQGSWDTR
jgi:hypothetical protein